MTRTLLRLLAASALLAFTAAPTDAARSAETSSRATVDHVADGDTIQVAVNGHREDVRLIGIDTPEVYFGAECGGPRITLKFTTSGLRLNIACHTFGPLRAEAQAALTHPPRSGS